MTSRDIARSLHISARTAESHLASVYRKLHVPSRDAAVSTYRGLVEAVSAPAKRHSENASGPSDPRPADAVRVGS